MTRLVAVTVRVGICQYCDEGPLSHGVDGRCFVAPLVPLEPIRFFDSGTLARGFVDADDHLSVMGGELRAYPDFV